MTDETNSGKVTKKTLLVLSPCALCGGENGFTLCEGSTHRWFSMICSSCGREVDEIRIAADPIAAWNAACEYAAGMLREIGQLRHDLAQSGKLAEDRLQQIKADRDEFRRQRSEWMAHR